MKYYMYITGIVTVSIYLDDILFGPESRRRRYGLVTASALIGVCVRVRARRIYHIILPHAIWAFRLVGFSAQRVAMVIRSNFHNNNRTIGREEMHLYIYAARTERANSNL